MDGVKVFKPTRNDKRLVKSFILNKDSSDNLTIPRSQLVQTKLNFNKKEDVKITGKCVYPCFSYRKGAIEEH